MVKKLVNSNNPIKIAKKYMGKWKIIKEELNKKFDKDLISLNDHLESVDPEIQVLEE